MNNYWLNRKEYRNASTNVYSFGCSTQQHFTNSAMCWAGSYVSSSVYGLTGYGGPTIIRSNGTFRI